MSFVLVCLDGVCPDIGWDEQENKMLMQWRSTLVVFGRIDLGSAFQSIKGCANRVVLGRGL